MGARPKAPVIVTPPAPEPLPEPDPIPATPQASPTAQRGNATNKGPAALAASMGMNNTIFAGRRPAPMSADGNSRRASLLGL